MILLKALIRVPTFLDNQGMSGNSVLTGMSRNCQGILAIKCRLHSCLCTEIIINVFLSLPLLTALCLVILLCWICMAKQDHYDLRGYSVQ